MGCWDVGTLELDPVLFSLLSIGRVLTMRATITHAYLTALIASLKGDSHAYDLTTRMPCRTSFTILTRLDVFFMMLRCMFIILFTSRPCTATRHPIDQDPRCPPFHTALKTSGLTCTLRNRLGQIFSSPKQRNKRRHSLRQGPHQIGYPSKELRV